MCVLYIYIRGKWKIYFIIELGKFVSIRTRYILKIYTFISDNFIALNFYIYFSNPAQSTLSTLMNYNIIVLLKKIY